MDRPKEENSCITFIVKRELIAISKKIIIIRLVNIYYLITWSSVVLFGILKFVLVVVPIALNKEFNFLISFFVVKCLGHKMEWSIKLITS